MPTVNLREFIAHARKEGHRKTAENLSEALTSGELKPQELSIRALAEALVPDGSEWVRSLDPRSNFGYVQESSAVDTTSFANITGQIVYTTIMQAYEQPEFVFSRVIPDQPTQFSGEKIAGIGQMGDKGESIGEGMPYPAVGVNEDYIETPATTKRGFKVPVTKEAIFFDRTGLVLQRAAEVGNFLGLNKEKRLIDCVIGATNNHKWKGTSYNTYQSSTPWVNVKTGNTLVDWGNVDGAEQTLYGMLDPNTGEPITIMPKHIVVNRAYLNAAIRATAPVVQSVTPGYATSGNPTESSFGVYRAAQYSILYSPLFNARQTAASQDARYWYLGDVSKTVVYMQNWPITVTQAPANHPDEFERDVVTQFKVSERGVAAVMNPRYLIQNQN